MLGVESLNLTYALDGSLLQGMAAKGVGGVGGVDDDPAIVQYLDYAVDVAVRIVLFVEFEYHDMLILP